MPWPLGVLAGIVAFLLIRYGVAAYLATAGGPFLGPLGKQLGGVLAPLAWIVMLGCWAAAVASYAGARRRRKLHDTRRALDSLADISWREFEMLVGESFRRRGYAVVEHGLGGKDGGIDLVVTKDGRRELVQCKQWRRRDVNASTVREMWGLVDHHRADAVHIVSLGGFTADAARFAEGKAIHLVTGRALFEQIRQAQSQPINPAVVVAPPTGDLAPACPTCTRAMVRRRNRRSGEQFWGCSGYPDCKGTR